MSKDDFVVVEPGLFGPPYRTPLIAPIEEEETVCKCGHISHDKNGCEYVYVLLFGNVRCRCSRFSKK